MVEQETVAFVAKLMQARLEFMQESHMMAIPKPSLPVLAPAQLPMQTTANQIGALLEQSTGKQAKLTCLQNDILGNCQRCKLASGRTHVVFGSGNADARLVFVGEGPGAEEDKQGMPFVGKAGQLLTKMIEAMGLKREDVYICNVVKSRPPDNRDPEPDEVAACEPFLKAQLAIIQPQVIVALGRYAVQCLLRTEAPISQLRGKWSAYEGIALMPTFHPAYLLREPAKKREAWEDLQAVMKKLGL